VVNPAPVQGRRGIRLSEEDIAFKEEEFQASRFGEAAGPSSTIAVTGLERFPRTLGRVIDPVPNRGIHLCAAVCEVEKRPTEGYCGGVVSVEREEPHPRGSGSVINVGTNV